MSKTVKDLFTELADKELLEVDAGWGKVQISLAIDLTHNDFTVLGLSEFKQKNVIQLSEDQSYRQGVETLIHELFHMIAFTHGLDPDGYSKIKIKNEDLVNYMSIGFMQAYRLNKPLFDFLLSTYEYNNRKN